MATLLFLIIMVCLFGFAIQKLSALIDPTKRPLPPVKEEPKAIDYDPNGVVGWEDIQWNVKKRLPDEK